VFLLGQSGIENVIIPVEKRLAGILQNGEEAGFHRVEHIEADKYIFVIAERVCVECFDNVAVKHPFIGYA